MSQLRRVGKGLGAPAPALAGFPRCAALLDTAAGAACPCPSADPSPLPLLDTCSLLTGAGVWQVDHELCESESAPLHFSFTLLLRRCFLLRGCTLAAVARPMCRPTGLLTCTPVCSVSLCLPAHQQTRRSCAPAPSRAFERSGRSAHFELSSGGGFERSASQQRGAPPPTHVDTNPCLSCR